MMKIRRKQEEEQKIRRVRKKGKKDINKVKRK